MSSLVADIIELLQASPLYSFDRVTSNEWSVIQPVGGGDPLYEAAAIVVRDRTVMEARSIGDGGNGGEERAMIYDEFPYIVSERADFAIRRDAHVADLLALLRGTALATGSAPIVKVETGKQPTADSAGDEATSNYFAVQTVLVTRRTRRFS